MNEFEELVECLGEHRTKVQNFFCVNRNRSYKIDIGGIKSVISIYYKIKLIDSARFVAKSLSNLADNLTKRIDEVKYKDCDCFLEYDSKNIFAVNGKNLVKRHCPKKMNFIAI